MSATLDVNVLLHASDTASDLHRRALEFLSVQLNGQNMLYLFWPTLMAYLRIATHPAIFRSPLDPTVAAANVQRLLAVPYVRSPGEADGFWETWQATCVDVVVRGNLVPDAHTVALMRQNGVGTIFTRDRDFAKFSGIRMIDPFA